MKLREAKEAYQDCSGILSSNVRNLCFAGIAIVWVFRIGTDIPAPLLAPLLCFVLSLSLDLLQYIVSSLVWWAFYLIKEKELNDEDETRAPKHINLPAELLLASKIIAVCVGYILIAKFLIGRIVNPSSDSIDFAALIY
jgi:small-conductance mechanosensitive channel